MLGQHTSWNVRKKIPFQKNIRNFSKVKRSAFFELGMKKCARFFSFLKIIRNFSKRAKISNSRSNQVSFQNVTSFQGAIFFRESMRFLLGIFFYFGVEIRKCIRPQKFPLVLSTFLYLSKVWSFLLLFVINKSIKFIENKNER